MSKVLNVVTFGLLGFALPKDAWKSGLMIAAGLVTGQPWLITAGISSFISTVGNSIFAPKNRATERNAASLNLSIGEQPREAVFGEAVVPGSLLDGFNHSGKHGTDWEVMPIILADHRCHSLLGYYVNDTYVAHAGDGPVAGYNGQLEIYHRLGTVGQTVPSVLTTHGGWSSSDRVRGCTWVVVCYKADAQDAANPIWTAGRPRFRFHIKGALCYDGRKDSTVPGGSGPHRWANPATREWTDNAEICRYNYDLGLYAEDDINNPTALLIGRGLSLAEAPPEKTFAAANLCDENVPLAAGGSEKRYRVGGTILASDEYGDVEKMFAAAMGGILIQPEGTVQVEPGHAKAPSFYFTDDDIVVGTTVSFSEDRSEADREWVNTVSARYCEPSQNWTDHSAPVRRNSGDVIADGGPRELPLNLRIVRSSTQAQRIAEIARRMGRLTATAGVTLGPAFCEVEEGDIGVWTSARRFGGTPRTFRVERYALDEKWRNSLTLREINSSVYSWSTADEIADGASAQATTPPSSYGMPPAGDWAATGTVVPSGPSELPAIVVEGAVTDRDCIGVLVEYAETGTGDWTALPVAAPITTRQVITAVSGLTDYDVGITYFYDRGRGTRRVLGPVTTGDLFIEGAIGADGVSVDVVYVRSATQPSTPAASPGVPSGWGGDPSTAPGTGLLWGSLGERATVGGNYVWQTAMQLEGVAGAAGYSYAELTIYKQAGSAPATPSGGSYNFGTKVLTPPSTWSADAGSFSGTTPVWMAKITASIQGAVGSSGTLGSWSSPGRVFSSGTDGNPGADGVSVDIVYTRSATQPSTPAASSGVPSGWGGDPSTAPGSGLLWASTGERATVGGNYVWQTAMQVEGAAGYSYAELTIYKQASSAPAAPSGGSYNFGTKVLTPPSTWSADAGSFSGTTPVWMAKITASIQGASGSSGTLGSWSSPGRVFSSGTDGNPGADGVSVDIVYKRSATQPSTPAASSGVPSGWGGDPSTAPGSGLLWASTGERATVGGNYVWQTPMQVEGSAGAAGYSYAELTVYKQAASAPSTPSGGSYDFGTKVTTPPSGWVADAGSFSGTDPVYMSKITASIQGSSGSSGTLGAWSSPGRVFASGATGAAGESIDIVYIRSSSQPSTPSPSSGVPSGWYGDPGSVPGGAGYIWSSVGSRTSPGGNYTWQAAVQLEGSTGATGESALSVSSVPPAITVPCTAGGTPKAAIPGFQISAKKGGTDVTASASYSYSASGLSGVSHAGAGAFTVGGMTAGTGYVDVTVTSGAVSQQIRVTFGKSFDGAPYVFDTKTSFSMPTSTSYVDIGQLLLLMGPNGDISCSCDGFFTRNGSGGSANVDGYIEVSLNGSSWTYLGSIVGIAAGPGETSSFISDDGSGGPILSISGATLGLSARQTVYIRVMMRKAGGSNFLDFSCGLSAWWQG